MKKNLGRIGLIIVAIIWGTGFVASALALDYYSPNQILAMRFTLAFLIVIILFFGKIKNSSKEHLKKGGIIGVFLFLAFFFQTVGLRYTTASKNAFLTAVNVVIVPFLSWFILKKAIPKNKIFGAIITLVGIGLISADGSLFRGINKGDLLTLICSLFFALQIFYTDYFVDDVDPEIIIVSQMGVAAILSWVMVLISGEFSFSFTMQSITPILYLGIVSTMVAYGIQTWSQKFTNSTETAVILSTEAFFGMLFSSLLLGETITGIMLVGAVLIFMGVVIVEY